MDIPDCMSSSPKTVITSTMAILLRALFLVSISKSKQGRQLFELDYLFIAIESEVYAIDYKWTDYIVCLHRRRS